MNSRSGKVAVIWIDWYAYHVARFRALTEHEALAGRMTGIELVGGAGVHRGMIFREKASAKLPVRTIAPESSWSEMGQRRLATLVWRELESVNPSVVLVPGYYTLPGLAAALWCKWRGRRSVLMTESTQGDHERTGWKERLKSHALRSLFDWAVAGGSAHIRYLKALRFPSERIARNYDVVDNAFFAQGAANIRTGRMRHEWKLPLKYFLFVGRLAPEKNVSGLLEAFAEYRNNGGAWSLVVAGDGPLRNDLFDLAKRLGISDEVHFRGHKSSAELLPYYAFARAFVLPSTREPWGLVVNEAMACGLPVAVSSRCGCAEDLVRHTVNGFIFDPSDNGALANCLHRLEELHPEELVRMGEASSAIIDRFSPETWAGEVARIVAA